MAAGFRVLSKYVGPVKLCVFDWAGKFTIPSSVKFISKYLKNLVKACSR